MIKSIGKFFANVFGKLKGKGNVFHPSEKCPECGTPLMRMIRGDELPGSQAESLPRGKDEDSSNSSLRHEDTNWRCPNLDCQGQIRARIEHWCSPAAMDIPGGDAAFVAALVRQGLVRDVAELYRLKVREIAALPGMNQDSAQKFFHLITASKKRDGWRVLFGLDIPHVGAEEAKSLCRHFVTVDNVLDANAEHLLEAEGVSEVTAHSIVHWQNDSVNRRLVKRLFKAGVNFKCELPGSR